MHAYMLWFRGGGLHSMCSSACACACGGGACACACMHLCTGAPPRWLIQQEAAAADPWFVRPPLADAAAPLLPFVTSQHHTQARYKHSQPVVEDWDRKPFGGLQLVLSGDPFQ